MFTEISNCKFSCFHDSCLQRGKTKRFYISVSGFGTGCAETVISCADRNDLMSLIIHLFHGIKVVTYDSDADIEVCLLGYNAAWTCRWIIFTRT